MRYQDYILHVVVTKFSKWKPSLYPLVVLHTISMISFHMWCILRGSV
jgi:hypothetical protein